jgi:hypothetical protein
MAYTQNPLESAVILGSASQEIHDLSLCGVSGSFPAFVHDGYLTDEEDISENIVWGFSPKRLRRHLPNDLPTRFLV